MAHPSSPSTGWTADRVRAELVDGERHWPRYEFVDGELLVTPAPRVEHQRAVGWLFLRLAPFVETHRLGEAFMAPADISFGGRDSIVQPDLFVVPPEYAGRRLQWIDVRALRLAVEILSPGSERADRVTKRRHYARHGVPEYWIVHLEARLVERWTARDARPEILPEALSWTPEPGGASLTLDLAALFDAACGPIAPPTLPGSSTDAGPHAADR